VYRDIVVQSAHDAGFKTGVTQLSNNDHDNSLKMGRGTDKEYIETYEGRLIDAKGVTGRYVRLYSRGSTGGDMNHYVEVEVHGRPPAKPTGPKLMDRFFTLNISNGARSLPPAKRAALVKEAGYAGQCQIGTKNMPAVIRAMDAAKLRLFACYIMVNVRTGTVPADLAQTVEAMKKHKTFVWVGLVGAKPSTTDHDDKAVSAVGEIAAIADKAGLKVALYPHVGFYAEKAADVLRIARKVGRENVGVTFNLCHFMKTQPGGDWKRALDDAAAKLFIVTICGADTDGKDWKRLIMPLDQGTFDVAKLLAHLDKMGFRGLIGVQDYGIGGDPREHLRRSMAAFRKLAGIAK
jgi:sugar phosphate isomerase/epimerase